MKISRSRSECARICLLAVMLLLPELVNAQLAVTVLPPKVVGQKAVVQLKLKNDLADEIESARAACFLLDDQGKIVGQSTKWVVAKTIRINLRNSRTGKLPFFAFFAVNLPPVPKSLAHRLAPDIRRSALDVRCFGIGNTSNVS
jgi:hypothetical protein